MRKLQDFIYDYGTDGLDAMIQAIVDQIPQEKIGLYQAGAITRKMSKRLAEALREIPPREKMSVDEVKDLMLNHSW